MLSVKLRPFWIIKMHSSFNQHATTVLAMNKLKRSRLPKLVHDSTQTVMVSFGPNGISVICLKVHHVVLGYDRDCEYVDRTRILTMCKKCATILGWNVPEVMCRRWEITPIITKLKVAMSSVPCGDLGHHALPHQVEWAFKYGSTNQIRLFKISNNARKALTDQKRLKFIMDHVTLPVVLARDKKECLMIFIS